MKVRTEKELERERKLVDDYRNNFYGINPRTGTYNTLCQSHKNYGELIKYAKNWERKEKLKKLNERS